MLRFRIDDAARIRDMTGAARTMLQSGKTLTRGKRVSTSTELLFRRSCSVAIGLMWAASIMVLPGTASANTLRSAAYSDAKAPLVYISDQLRNVIDVFHRNGTVVAQITSSLSFPSGLFVDASHNLWVANGGDHNILKFKRGATTPAQTYVDSQQRSPTAVTMCPDGTLYVADGDIAVFPAGHRKPTGTLSSQYGVIQYVTCDAAGNVFATATVFSPPGYVVEFAGGQGAGTLLPITLNNPSDIKIDAAGNLLVVDNEIPGSVTEYTEAGSPTGRALKLASNWMSIAVPPTGTDLYATDDTLGTGVLTTFPSGRLRQEYHDSAFKQIYGIAFDPG